MLILPIKKKWYDMIRDGVKKEEYREIKPYYTKRFQNIGLLSFMEDVPNLWTKKVMFRNGYSDDSPSFVADVRLEIKEGKKEWGAVPGTKYYSLKIEEIHL